MADGQFHRGQRRVLDLLAEILEYPQSDLTKPARECAELVLQQSPEAAAYLGEFHDFAATTPLGRLQEVYTGTFDLNAACDPYLGYHLFGESYKRSAFMLEMKERYKAHGFTVKANELPDHLAVVLRFLAACDDATLAGELIEEGVLPVVKQMIGTSEEDDPEAVEGEQPEPSPGRKVYQQVLRALELVLMRVDCAATSQRPADGRELKAAAKE